jgi:general secretion pathway protein H
VFDLAQHRYGIDGDPPKNLPAELSIELLTTVGERMGTQRAGIRFNPDGSSTGGRVSLADGHRQVVVGVEWLSGQITVSDVR